MRESPIKNAMVSRRLSDPELIQSILDMAKTGVYRESILEALHPFATKTKIRLAIAKAKTLGLRSVADLRDDALGTYYHMDGVDYHHSLQSVAALKPDCLTTPTRLSGPAQDLMAMMQWLVRLSLVGVVGLTAGGMTCAATGHGQIAEGLMIGAVGVALIWYSQKRIVQRCAARFTRSQRDRTTP